MAVGEQIQIEDAAPPLTRGLGATVEASADLPVGSRSVGEMARFVPYRVRGTEFVRAVDDESPQQSAHLQGAGAG